MEGKRTAFRVLGIDPGLHVTGYGVIDFGRGGPQLVEAGTIRTNPRGELSGRLQQLHADLSELLAEHRPDLTAIEQLYAHYKHPRTSILMAHARGIVILAAAQAGIGVQSLAATHVKKSLTGNGHASKVQMQRSVQAVFRLAELPQPPDVADAIAIALAAGSSADAAPRGGRSALAAAGRKCADATACPYTINSEIRNQQSEISSPTRRQSPRFRKAQA